MGLAWPTPKFIAIPVAVIGGLAVLQLLTPPDGLQHIKNSDGSGAWLALFASFISGLFVLVGLKFAGVDEDWAVWLGFVLAIIICPFAVPAIVGTIKRMERWDGEQAEVAAAEWERSSAKSADQFGK